MKTDYLSIGKEGLERLCRSARDMDPAYQKDVERVMTTGQRAAVYFYFYSEASGVHTTAGIPAQTSDGRIVAWLGVEKAMSALDSARGTYARNVLCITAAAVALFLVIYITFLRKRLVNPLLTITKEAGRFAEDNEARTDILEQISRSDEIGTLAQAIAKMETEIVEYVENLTAVTAEKERIEAELNVATQIQADMLPNIISFLPSRSGPSLTSTPPWSLPRRWAATSTTFSWWMRTTWPWSWRTCLAKGYPPRCSWS